MSLPLDMLRFCALAARTCSEISLESGQCCTHLQQHAMNPAVQIVTASFHARNLPGTEAAAQASEAELGQPYRQPACSCRVSFTLSPCAQVSSLDIMAHVTCPSCHAAPVSTLAARLFAHAF